MANTVAYIFPNNTGATPPALGVPVDLVGATVTDDGTAGAITITHNLEVSSADLGRGLPMVRVEPLSALVTSTVEWYISSKTSNTVVITVAGGGDSPPTGSFNVWIERPNTDFR